MGLQPLDGSPNGDALGTDPPNLQVLAAPNPLDCPWNEAAGTWVLLGNLLENRANLGEFDPARASMLVLLSGDGLD
eukprot:scaffold2243_cov122-Cylindrotheca_fusiformis.AAC.2